MIDLVKTDVPGYVKDKQTSIVLNNNLEQFEAIKTARKKFKEAQQMKQEIEDLKARVTRLEAIINEQNTNTN